MDLNEQNNCIIQNTSTTYNKVKIYNYFQQTFVMACDEEIILLQ